MQIDSETNWSKCENLPFDIHGCVTVVTSSKVYLLGGVVNSDWSNRIYSAPILSDQSLGKFELEGLLPTRTAYPAIVNTGEKVYIVGGLNEEYLTSVYSSPINVDGNLGGWTSEISLPSDIIDPKAILTTSGIMVFGNGYEDETLVLSSPVGDLPLHWRPEGIPLSISSATKIVGMGSYLYSLDGIFGHLSRLVRIKLDKNGFLEDFLIGPPTPVTTDGAAVVVYKDTCYLIGGDDYTEFQPVNSVHSFKHSSEESFGEWKEHKPLPIGLAHPSAVIVGDNLYVIGGYVKEGMIDRNKYKANTVYTIKLKDL